MKKYIKPATEVIKVSVQTILAFSNVENGQDLNDAPETTETSGNMSRRHDVWGDEEEEEKDF